MIVADRSPTGDLARAIRRLDIPLEIGQAATPRRA